MKERVNVSLVQFASAHLDRETNARRMAEFVVAEGRDHDADLVVFPELASTGYVDAHPDAAFAKALQEQSELIPGPTTDALGEAARAGGTHVIAGVSELHPTIPHVLLNAAVLVGPMGELIGVQRKVHACLAEKNYYGEGDSIELFDTAIGKIGINVCYDARFPEVARVQALAGAEIIVSIWASAVQGGKVPVTSIQERTATRAMENALYFLGCNRSGDEGPRHFYGRSAVAAPSGELLAVSENDEEEVVRAELTAEALAAQRAYLTIFRDRRPDLYGAIVSKLGT
jgi:predicted amidohydrolase